MKNAINIFFFLITFSSFVLYPVSCLCEEKYFIADEQVLLYKIINWWDDCLINKDQISQMKPNIFESQEKFEIRKEAARLQFSNCDQFKGKTIKYSISGNTKMEYFKDTQELRMTFEEEVAALLDLNSYKNEQVSMYFNCVQLHEQYFSGFEPGEYVYATIEKNIIHFIGISEADANIVKKAEAEIEAVITGIVKGLENSKITLQDSRKFNDMLKIDAPYEPVSLSIVNVNTGKILMKYSAALNADGG